MNASVASQQENDFAWALVARQHNLPISVLRMSTVTITPAEGDPPLGKIVLFDGEWR